MGKNLAIKGHPTRGKEVIELLEMMGGKNNCDSPADNLGLCYLIDDEFDICAHYFGYDDYEDGELTIFTLEEFLEKYPFKVRDFVRIPEYESELCILKMKWCLVSEHIEYLVCPNDDEEWFTADELLEYNDNPIKTRDCKKCGLHFGSVRCFDKDCPHNTPKNKDGVYSISECKTIGQGTYAIKIADGYKFDSVDENGNIIVKSIKSTYPKTYEECFNEHTTQSALSLLANKTDKLYDLLICCDAYWKIAGEQMGLDKPWEPDWMDEKTKYTIKAYQNHIIKDKVLRSNCILVFPIEEMRDAFYENFKDLIEQCKELL